MLGEEKFDLVWNSTSKFRKRSYSNDERYNLGHENKAIVQCINNGCFCQQNMLLANNPINTEQTIESSPLKRLSTFDKVWILSGI